jgi:3-polyprenyl-4-hydroxybenzoate decarboxylase
LLRAIRDNFDPREDLLVLHRTSLDTLDFTGMEMNLGSKMILDATSSGKEDSVLPPPPVSPPAGLEAAGANESRLWEKTLLAVKCGPGKGREVLKKLLSRPDLSGVKIIAAVSEDVDLSDDTSLLWGIFTRFDCARDLCFARSEIGGARPFFTGPVGIDATFKQGYPDPVEMDEKILEKVRGRWPEYKIRS